MILVPSARRLRPSVATPAEGGLDAPVVRVRARFGRIWATAGTGFIIAEWPSCVITARHVVALADGTPPSEVVVKGVLAGRWVTLEAAVVGFAKGGPPDDDVAIVRLNTRVSSPLRLAQLEAPESAEIWGYPVGNELPRPPLAIRARARFVASRLVLDHQARIGMSGAPVVIVPSEGPPVAAVGIYLGPAQNAGGRVHAVAGESIFVCKDAAVNCP
jgi:hypothetical protein